MSTAVSKSALVGVTLALLCPLSDPVTAAKPDNWSDIPVHTVVLFYPGQSSYQWLRGKEHKKAYQKTRRGEACLSCHEEEEADIGDLIVTGERLEPYPIPGKPGSVDLAVQAVHDADNLYLRFQWKTNRSVPGSAHTYWRFDGQQWQAYGSSRMQKEVREGGTPAIHEDRLSIMIDDGSVPMFAQQGCWLTCHDGMVDMHKAAKPSSVEAHPLLGAVLKKKDVRKYLPASRMDAWASWNKTKTADDIAKLMSTGGFVDLMQWQGYRSNSVGMAADGYVLEYRRADNGKGIYAANWDASKGQPLMMFDQSKTGFKSLRLENLQDSLAAALVTGSNTVAYNPDAAWVKGDVLPQYLVSRASAQGSAADNQDVTGVWKDGTWTVVWVRKLNSGNADDKLLQVGGVVTVGFAVHDDNIDSRGHYVSFPLSLGLGTDADITATTLK